MATSTLKLYATAIDPARNMIVEDIETYLSGLPSASVNNIGSVMFVKPGLEVQIRIPWNQEHSWNSSGFNYARVTIPGENNSYQTLYYYITQSRWCAEQTVELTLTLDTINTYWDSVKGKFTNDTHITRQHQDRFYANGMRKIDKFDEGIVPVTYLQSHVEVKDHANHVPDKWYLIYKSDSSESNSGIRCYACAQGSVPYLQGQSASTTRWTNTQFTSGYFYYIIEETDITSAEIGVQYYSNPYTSVTTSAAKPIIKIYLDSNGYIQVRRYSVDGTPDSGYPYNVALSWVDFIKTRRMYKGTTDTIQLSDIRAMTKVTIQAGNIGMLFINSFNSLDRTDPLLIKIIQLPYAPFQISYTTSSNIDYINIPSGWSYDNGTGMLKLGAGSTYLNFDQTLATQSLSGIAYVGVSPGTTDVPDINNESKLWNSTFNKTKFSYDSYSWVFAPEDITVTNPTATLTTVPALTVMFRQSHDINSNCGFKFVYNGNSAGGKQEMRTDYGEYMISDRNNEMPLFNNEYLNYLKYGKQYADKATATTLTSTWLQSLLSIGGGMAAGAIFGHAPGALIGAVVGAISGISSAITTTVKTIDAQQQKEWELQHQITNISSNNDVNLFNWYNNNTLQVLSYAPSAEMKDLLWKLFFRGGYACDTYGIPNTHTRYRFNFVQCEPVFSLTSNSIYKEYIDDIKAHFRAGVTIFHHHSDGWDFNYACENWENFWFN